MLYVRCIKMGGWKNCKEPNEKKRLSIVYQGNKIQKVSSPKMKGLKKLN